MIKNLIIYFVLIASSFIIGIKWQEFQYDAKNSMESHDYIAITKPKETFKLDKNSKKLIGRWLIKGENWGFTLYNDGTASSINSATLIYQQWHLKNSKLCLTTRSIGNHTQSVSKECLNYKIAGKDNKAILSIGKGKSKITYIR